MAYKTDSVINDDIGEVVRAMEHSYIHGTQKLSKYVEGSMWEDINRIEAYLYSRHTTGDTDSLGREKPFFNICVAAVNIWYRATDIDRKHIKIRATKREDETAAFLATVCVQDWMRRSKYGTFLNDWGRALAIYGSAVVKHVEKGDELIASVVPWQRLIVDPIDFDSNPKVELLELTEAQLYQNPSYDRKMVDKLCDARKARELIDGTDVDNKSDYIKLYEIHGKLPLSYLTGKEEDKDIYAQQMHVISFVASKEEGSYDDFTLYSGRERVDPYMITHLIKEDGQTLSYGAIRNLFDAQWMMNHSMKTIKDQLDLASKIIFQTTDGNFAAQNALNDIENGDIFYAQAPITQVNMTSHDKGALAAYANQWKALSSEISGVPDAMMGNTQPSGTAWRQVEAVLNEAHSLFELMTENKGNHIEDMFRTYVIPFIKRKKLKNKDEIVAVLEANDIAEIDSKFIKAKAAQMVNYEIVEQVLNEGEPTPEDMAMMMQEAEEGLQTKLQSMGNTRYFAPSELDDKTWADVLADIEWDLEVDVTGESRATRDDLATLSTVFQTIADPARRSVLQTPEGKMVFNEILSITSTISPLRLNNTPAPQPLQAPAMEM